MKIKLYSLTTFLLLLFSISLVNAQKFEKEYINEIPFKKGNNVTLIANYADIEIKEWNKSKIKVHAVMNVEGVSHDEANKHFDAWNINVSTNNANVIIKSKSQFNNFKNFDFDFEMPEISIESLGMLDSIGSSLSAIDFDRIFNLKNKYSSVYYINTDSISDLSAKILDNIDYEKLRNNAEYLKKWQEDNKERIEKLIENSIRLSKKANEMFERREKMEKLREKIKKEQVDKVEERNEKRDLLRKEVREKMLKKRAELIKQQQGKASAEKRKETVAKIKENKVKRDSLRKELRKKILKKRSVINKKRQQKIKQILKNRGAAKVRTKLVIFVPKGTEIDMNINYSKISTN